MRFIVLRTSVTEDGKLILQGLNSLLQKPVCVDGGWIDLADATTNCLEPQNCDLLSFEDKDELERNLEIWNIAAENIAIIGVEPG